LVVDDSAFMRGAIQKLLERDGRFEVIGQAKNGQEAVAMSARLRPHVISMDFNMPVMNGADATRAIMGLDRIPIVILSAHAREGAAETLEALSAGAVDFVMKPSGEVSTDLTKVAGELAEKLLAAAGAHPMPVTPAKPPPGPRVVRSIPPPSGLQLVVIAISTGGPAALRHVIPALPADTRFAAVIVQHMPAEFTAALAARLHEESEVTVREAQVGDRPLPAQVLVAPGDQHLVFGDYGAIRLTNGEPVNGCRPSADVTLASAAELFGRRVTAVVMTGMGKDGAEGLAKVHAAGGRTIAQDARTSVVWGMPKAAIDRGVVDEVLPLDEIAPRLLR
jgi:two-component system chemotaxis response regulator CheB